MNDSTKTEPDLGEITHEEMMSALFAQLVIQQSNMAMLLLGKVPNPETGQTIRDVEAARLFIDQLEMLEVKTKGNLRKEEEQLLKQSLMSLRMAFVEAVQSPESAPTKPESAPAAEEKKIEPGASEQTADADSKKKFTKKY
jgi:Domain of unknown function (DUF1844)